LEIAFEGKPKGYRTPNYKVHKYEQSQDLVVLFEVEVRLVRHYIKCEYDNLEIERAICRCMVAYSDVMRI